MRVIGFLLAATLATGCGAWSAAGSDGTLVAVSQQSQLNASGSHTQPADAEDPPLDPQSADTRSSGIYETLTTFTVTKILPDRNGHEHLLLKSCSGEGVELAHNLALAPRVPAQVGDTLTVRGQYICTSAGDPSFPNDVIHWTHHDPAHHHLDGYIVWHGQTFQ